VKLKDLCSWRRWQRCRTIFRHPARVHWQIALARPEPLDLELCTGGTVRVPDMHRARPMFDWLLERARAPLPVTAEDGLIIFQHDGQRVTLRPNGFEFEVFREIFVDDMYGIDRLPEPLGTVVDLGTNVGLFALRVGPRAERVIGVEPVAANLTLAQRNTTAGGIQRQVTIHKLAVTGESGKIVRIHLSGNNSGAHSISAENVAAWQAAGCEEVPTISLADLFAREKIDRCALLKCDVEGAEFEIFRHAPREVLARIDRIVMEVHPAAQAGGLEELCATMRAGGFDVEHGPLVDRRGRPRTTLMLTAQARRQA
jgi:FkbM family methyltransferase